MLPNFTYFIRRPVDVTVVLTFGAGVQDMKLDPESGSCRLQISRLRLRIGIGRVDENANNRRGGQQLAHQLKALGSHLRG
jgi:hypothetical protein